MLPDTKGPVCERNILSVKSFNSCEIYRRGGTWLIRTLTKLVRDYVIVCSTVLLTKVTYAHDINIKLKEIELCNWICNISSSSIAA